MRQTAHSSARDAEAVRPGKNVEAADGDTAGRGLQQRLEVEESAEKVLVRRARRLGLLLMIVSALAVLALLSAAWLGLSGAF